MLVGMVMLVKLVMEMMVEVNSIDGDGAVMVKVVMEGDGADGGGNGGGKRAVLVG